MEKLRFNERKVEVLEFLLKSPGSTSRSLSLGLKISVINSRTILHRLFKQALTDRTQEGTTGFRKPCFSYSISERGLDRLKFLTEKA